MLDQPGQHTDHNSPHPSVTVSVLKHALHSDDLLGNESSGLTALSDVCSFREQQLRLMEDIHQHRELSVHQWLQTLLQSVYDVLRTEGTRENTVYCKLM